jgi:hypothetical protein
METAASNAQQIQRVGGGLEVVALLLGFPGIDSHYQEVLLAQLAQKVLGVRGVILSAKEHVLATHLPGLGAGPNLPEQLGCPLGGVLNGKAGFE